MQSVSPVFGEQEVQFEKVIAFDQPEYEPIIAIPISVEVPEQGTVKNFAMTVRFRLTNLEREAIANGADLIITELTFDKPFTPLNFQLCQSDQKPEF